MRNLAFFAMLMLCVPAVSCTRGPRHPSPPVDQRAGAVVVEIDGLANSAPQYYSLSFGERPVHFFVVKVGDDVRSYLDACERCYRKGKGFRTEGRGVICNTCNVGYPVEELDGLGSCHPIPLPGKRDGERYLIALADLKAGCEKFP